MSLLLDALKKAADDKKKQSSAATDNDSADDALHIEKPQDNHQNEIDLDLDLQEDKPEAVLDNQKDEFPEVDEEVIQQHKESQQEAEPVVESEPEAETEIGTPVEHSDATEDETSISIDSEDTALELEDTAHHQSEDGEADVVPDASPEKEPADNLSSEIKQNGNPSPTDIPEDKRDDITRRIENEQALSALINKSNQHSRRSQLKRTIYISIIVALVIIGSGIYFFIQMQTETQNLYIAQNNSAMVERQVTTMSRVTKPESKPATVNKTTPNTQAVKQAQRPLKQSPAIRETVSIETPQTEAITIIHTTKQDPIDQLLRDAYNAFHKQDYKKSHNLYEKVLQREARNRDAILGLAAIAVKQDRFEYARQKYQALLKLNPKDSIANAGLSNIKNRIDPQLNETQLKFLLKEQPDSAPLYFALGSLYASQNKWPEAQSSYFSAWSAENKNSDYAYNLAVSLDHLGQQSQALNFYKLSLQLKQASNGNFSSEATQQRINTIQESAQ